jgi:transcriptional regulator with XRE-family HTH domain
MGSENYSQNLALGSALRAIRLRLKESLLEVSSAIEITGERLARIENGEYTPTEDILHLLLSHYGVTEKEEDSLWELAGFGKKNASDAHENTVPQNFFVMPLDTRVMYADSMQVVVNDHGVILSFMQPNGMGQQLAVSKIGMSLAHAKNVLNVLEKTIQQSEAGSTSQKRLKAENDN